MFSFDHFVLNIDEKYQKDKEIVNKVRENGFPYEPTWGKSTSGFKASNLWIGNEYLEMINILNPKGGGWKEEWVKLYNSGNRGMVCIMLDTPDIKKVYTMLKNKGVSVTKPVNLQFKWFLNLLTRVMPWKNCYCDFFEGLPLQIGFQQMDDEKAREFMTAYMVPNSRDNKIEGISRVIIKGAFTKKDKELISLVFGEVTKEKNNLEIKLNDNQTLVFEEGKEYSVELYTNCINEDYTGNIINFENVKIINK